MTPAYVSLTVTRAECVKTAERIDILFGVETLGEGSGSLRLLPNYFGHLLVIFLSVNDQVMSGPFIYNIPSLLLCIFAKINNKQ